MNRLSNPTAFERARSQLIARRLPFFALSWLATTVAWATVLVIGSEATTVEAVATVIFQAVVLAGAHAACRRNRSAGRVPIVAIGTCVALALSTMVFCALAHAHAHVLAFMLLTLYLAAALLFAWGWRAELAVVATTLAASMATFPLLEFVVPWLEFATAIAIGAGVSLAIAEGAARAFRTAFFHRASEQTRRRELEASHAAYRDLAENARDLIYTADLDGRFTYLNAALARFLGEPASQLRGRSVVEFTSDHPANPDPMRVIAQIGAGETLPPLLFEVRTPGGRRWLEALLSAVRAGGRVVGLRGISRDVTERKQAEEALRSSEERFRNVFGLAPIGMAVVGLDGRTLQVNRALCEMLGYTEAEMTGMPVELVTHPDDLDATVQHVSRLLSGETGGFEMEKRYRHKQGHLVWVLLSSSVSRDTEGRPAYVVSQVQDITDRKRAEEEIRQSEARYRDLVEMQQDVIVRTDPSSRITFVNDAFCRKFGVTREVMLATTTLELRGVLFHPDDVAETTAAIRKLYKPPYRFSTDNRARTPGGWRWISWDACAILDAAGAIVEIQSVGRDVTERKEAEEALRASLEDLQQSEEKLRLLAQRQAQVREEERRRLGFDLHDDVCQELIGIGILVESLRHKLAPLPDGADADITRVGRYLNELVEHLRLLARDLQPMMLRDLGLEGSLRSLADGLSSPKTRVTAGFATAIPRLDELAEVAVYRIAQEALSNATRHAAASTIMLTLEVADGTLRLEVRDDGCGFGREARQHADALGLVSMEERALALGGRFELCSTPGGGTTVRLECPVVTRASASAA